MILNPNCSETVIRLKKNDIKNLGREELRIYNNIISDSCCMYNPTEGYSELRSDEIWKAHFYYQTEGNELVAFALWLNLEFDTDEIWHAWDILDMNDEDLQEYLSQMFTEFEDIYLYPNCSEWSTELEVDISELNYQEKLVLVKLMFDDNKVNVDEKQSYIDTEMSEKHISDLIFSLPFKEKISWKEI